MLPSESSQLLGRSAIRSHPDVNQTVLFSGILAREEHIWFFEWSL
jgi:hypothetical protein